MCLYHTQGKCTMVFLFLPSTCLIKCLYQIIKEILMVLFSFFLFLQICRWMILFTLTSLIMIAQETFKSILLI
jgi:hypothetical protein